MVKEICRYKTYDAGSSKITVDDIQLLRKDSGSEWVTLIVATTKRFGSGQEVRDEYYGIDSFLEYVVGIAAGDK